MANTRTTPVGTAHNIVRGLSASSTIRAEGGKRHGKHMARKARMRGNPKVSRAMIEKALEIDPDAMISTDGSMIVYRRKS